MPLLGIAAELSAPPSSPTSFREVAMHGRLARGYDVVALCPEWQRDSYYHWFRTYGIFDYVAEILPREQLGILAVEIEGGPGTRLTAHNLREVIALL